MAGPWEDFKPNVAQKQKMPWEEFKPKEEEQGVFSPETNSAVSGLLGQMKSQYGSGSAKEALQAGLETLPTAGMMAGGMLGGGAGFLAPVPGGAAIGGVGGAALGSAAGESLKRLGEKYLIGKQGPQSSGEYLGDIGEAALSGAKNEMLGSAVAVPMGILGKKLAAYEDVLKENAGAIKEAAKRLGFEPTGAMLSSNPTLQKMESSLSQSPRITANPERQAYENVSKGIGRVSEGLESLKSGESNYQLGANLQKGLSEEIQAAKQPVSELYQDVNKDLHKIDLQPRIINKNIGSLKKNPLFVGKSGNEFLSDIRSDLSDLKTVGDLKEYRTNLLKRIPPGDEFSRARFEKVYDQITNLRDESIQALKETDPFVKASGKSGPEVIDELHNRLALADAAHAGNMSQLQKIKEIAGIKGDVKSQGQFLRNLQNIPKEDLIETAANTSIDTLKEFKDKFPALYKNAQQAKINDLVAKASNFKGGFNINSFIKQVDKLEPEVQANIFTKDQLQTINDMKLINKETPLPSGPSGTPQGLDYKEIGSPSGYASDMARGLILRNQGLVKSTSQNLQSPALGPFIKGLLMQKAQMNRSERP